VVVGVSGMRFHWHLMFVWCFWKAFDVCVVCWDVQAPHFSRGAQPYGDRAGAVSQHSATVALYLTRLAGLCGVRYGAHVDRADSDVLVLHGTPSSTMSGLSTILPTLPMLHVLIVSTSRWFEHAMHSLVRPKV
jgi:hypothetical protein